MSQPSLPFACSISRISLAAEKWLARAIAPRVFQVFDQVLNLIDRDNHILTIQFSGQEMGPFSLEILPNDRSRPGNPFSAFIRDEDPVSCEMDHLTISNMTITARNLIRWNPRPRWESLRKNWDLVDRWLPELSPWLLAQAPEGSLTPLVDPALSRDPGVNLAPNPFYLRKAAELSLLLMQAINSNSNDLDQALAAASRLAGLGVGLTPSGDDFLMGCIHALWAFWEQDKASRWSRALTDVAAPRTTMLSGAYLVAASQGEAGEYWHQLFEAMTANDSNGLFRSASQIIRKGHTSGADALAGFLVTSRTLLPSI